jgi:Bacterial Ig domain
MRLALRTLLAAFVLVVLVIVPTSSGAETLGVSISSPTDGQTINGKVTWQALVSSGSAYKVTFAVDEVEKWTEYASPYIFNGDGNTLDTTTLADGPHTLSVSAYGTEGQRASATIRVTVANTQAPNVTPAQTFDVAIASPANGATVSGSIKWEATVTGGTAASIKFLVDGVEKWTEYWSPYVFQGDTGTLDTTTLANGSHSLAVQAVDGSGRPASASVQVNVSNSAAAPTPTRTPTPTPTPTALPTRTPTPTPTPPPASPPASASLYSSTSPLNTPIAAGAAVDPASSTMVSVLASVGSFNIAATRWTVAVYYADASTPKTTVSMTSSWAPYRRLSGVPIPASAKPDPMGDGHMVVIDKSTGCEYDFYQGYKSSAGVWSAGWANTLKTDGTGIFPYGMSARESGFGLGAGLILPSEIAAGQISHALAFNFPYTKAGGPVLPATEASGKVSVTGAIPEGARLQLNPSLNLDTLGLSPWQKAVARALQVYGMYLVDTGGSTVGLYAQNTASIAGSYPWGSIDYPALPASLLGQLRVLKLGAQYTPSYKLVPTGCGTFS